MEFAIITLFLAAAAGSILWPWYNGDSPRWVLATVFVLLASPAIYDEWRMRSVEAYASAAIQEQSGMTDLSVSCDRFSNYFVQTSPYAGEVAFNSDGTPAKETQLTYQTCLDLFDAKSSLPGELNGDETFALHVLSHELQHLKGIRDEAMAECYAHQSNVTLLKRLGATNAVEMARLNFRNHYEKLPQRYKSGQCRIGGSLDLGLTDSVFIRP